MGVNLPPQKHIKLLVVFYFLFQITAHVKLSFQSCFPAVMDMDPS